MQAAPQLDSVFLALADNTRRSILARLARREQTVGELSAPFPISAPAITKHLKVLQRAGLIERRIEGRTHHCRLHPEGLKCARDWIEFYRRFWTERLEALEELISDGPSNPEQ